MALISHKYQLLKKILFISTRYIRKHWENEIYALFTSRTYYDISNLYKPPYLDIEVRSFRKYHSQLGIYNPYDTRRYQSLIWDRSFAVFNRKYRF